MYFRPSTHARPPTSAASLARRIVGVRSATSSTAWRRLYSEDVDVRDAQGNVTEFEASNGRARGIVFRKVSR